MKESFAISTRAIWLSWVQHRTFMFDMRHAISEIRDVQGRLVMQKQSGSFFQLGKMPRAWFRLVRRQHFPGKKPLTQLGNRLNMWAICEWKCIEKKAIAFAFLCDCVVAFFFRRLIGIENQWARSRQFYTRTQYLLFRLFLSFTRSFTLVCDVRWQYRWRHKIYATL